MLGTRDKDELYSLDPSAKLPVDLVEGEPGDTQALKLFSALKDEIFYVRLKQMLWEQYRVHSSQALTNGEKSKPTGSNSGSSVDGPKEMAGAVSGLMESSGAKEVLKDVAVKIYERALALSTRRQVYSCAPTAAAGVLVSARRSADEAVESIRAARVQWEQGINEELHAIVKESKRAPVLVRSPQEKSPFLESISPHAPAASQPATLTQQAPAAAAVLAAPHHDTVKFLFDSEDLLETGLAIRSANAHLGLAHLTAAASTAGRGSAAAGVETGAGGVGAGALSDMYLGLLRLELHVPDLERVVKQFSELSCALPQLGLDEGSPAHGARFCALRHEEAEAVLQPGGGGGVVEVRHFLRRGVPPALRARMWRRACGLREEVAQAEEQTFAALRAECDRLDLLTDELFLHDIHTVVDDPRFFIFEDELKDVVFCFSRDDWVRENSHYEVHAPLTGLIQPVPTPVAVSVASSAAAAASAPAPTAGREGAGGGGGGGVETQVELQMRMPLPEGTALPPCAVVPYLGFCTYFAPMCYVFKARASLYAVCRALWCRLWCRLNVLSSDPGTLLPVCKTFEVLLAQACPRLVLHLLSLGVQPLKIAFPWMQLGFVGLLEVDQLLHLWDRVIGYMDLTLLAVMAAAIFAERSEPLMKCSTESEVSLVLMEASRLQIVPLLQMFLFRDTRS